MRETIARAAPRRAAAARHARQVKFSLSLRPVLAETEEYDLGVTTFLIRGHHVKRRAGEPLVYYDRRYRDFTTAP